MAEKSIDSNHSKIDTCVTQYVFGSYTKYVPLYIYSILTAYPDYFVKIFVGGRMTESEWKAMELMPNGNYEIQEMYHADKVRDGILPKYIRRLIPYEEFARFKYVYHGDVDFIILREEPSLHEWHVNHCERLQLPFSNAIRPNSKRISGLHFIIVKPYYEAIGELLNYYLEHCDLVEKALVHTSDEWFTYDLLNKTFDLTRLKTDGFQRPEHGVHLALWRKSAMDPKTLEHRLKYFKDNKHVIIDRLQDPGLKRVVSATKNDSLIKEISKCTQFFIEL